MFERNTTRRRKPSPLVARHIKIGAQGAPDITRLHTGLDGLGCGPPPDTRQHVVDDQRRPANSTELRINQVVEFGQPHPTNLPSRRQRSARNPFSHTCTGSATPSMVRPAATAACR